MVQTTPSQVSAEWGLDPYVLRVLDLFKEKVIDGAFQIFQFFEVRSFQK
jgi:hypothetical protein